MNEAEPTTRLRLHVSTAVQGELFPATPRFKSRRKWRLFLYFQRFPPLPNSLQFTPNHCNYRKDVGKMWARMGTAHQIIGSPRHWRAHRSTARFSSSSPSSRRKPAFLPSEAGSSFLITPRS